MIKLYEEYVESLNESISDKDWNRMIDLYVTNKDGDHIADKIKDKNKAINRFVTGLKISNTEIELDKYSSTPKFNRYNKFSSFGNKALELGATVEEIEKII